MAKRVLTILFAVIMLFGFAGETNALSSQREHDNELRDALFGKGYTLSGEAKDNFQAIADAAALCIDQFSTNETERSKERLFISLNERIGFSFAFDEVELQKGIGVINVTSQTHRYYTHRGWDFAHPLPDLWIQRKKILTATANKVLFSRSAGLLAMLPFAEGTLYSEDACNPQCEAFCKLVYYVHILGDYEEATSYTSQFQQLVPLVRHEDQTSPALISDVISALRVLFADQSWSLNNLVQELEGIEARAERLLVANGGIRTQEQFDAYQKCGKDVYNTLCALLPGMLKKVDFFAEAFYKQKKMGKGIRYE